MFLKRFHFILISNTNFFYYHLFFFNPNTYYFFTIFKKEVKHICLCMYFYLSLYFSFPLLFFSPPPSPITVSAPPC